MSLIGASHYSELINTSEKGVYDIGTILDIISSGAPSICTPWYTMSFYSALVDKYMHARYHNRDVTKKWDNYGRIKRTIIWQ